MGWDEASRPEARWPEAGRPEAGRPLQAGSLDDARSVRKSRIYPLLEWGSGGTRLSHGRSKTERVELGAFLSVRPLSRLDPTFCTFFVPKSVDFGHFPASFAQFSELCWGTAGIVWG